MVRDLCQPLLCVLAFNVLGLSVPLGLPASDPECWFTHHVHLVCV